MPLRLRSLLSLLVALSFTAVFIKGFFYDGTPIAKYFAHQSELERVNEVEVINYMDAVLFGGVGAEKGAPEEAQASDEEGFLATEKIFAYDRVGLLVVLVYAWLMVVPVVARQRWMAFGYLGMAAYIIALALFKGLNGGSIYSELAIPAHATRWLACGMLFVWFWMRSEEGRRESVVYGGLALGCAVTFAIHGYEAFMLNPGFQDLVYGSLKRFSISPSEGFVEGLLRSIGVMDFCLAGLVLFSRNKYLLLWMAFWGGVTALSRPMAFGDLAWAESLLRVTNCGLPLILFLLTRSNITKTDEIIAND
jgi:hypothetical protein